MFCIGVIGSDGSGWVGNEQGEGASRRSAGSSCNALVRVWVGALRGEGVLPEGSREVGAAGERPWKAGSGLTERRGENVGYGGSWSKPPGRAVLRNAHSPRVRCGMIPIVQCGKLSPWEGKHKLKVPLHPHFSPLSSTTTPTYIFLPLHLFFSSYFVSAEAEKWPSNVQNL